ncbi:Uncharacterised protein [Mycobacteroides abscessus subsp. abscessus]|nr:Uncharacterised protein [Mycobacteroides abscessus subsp. abscessus]
MRAYAAREYLFIPVVVDYGCERGCFGVQCDRRQRLTFVAEPTDQLGGEVLGFGGAATIAAHQQASTAS